ncbi:hypothetical protein Nepgr_032796, partial [Nepenthes gracilis]
RCITMADKEVDKHDESAESRKEDNAITVHLIPMFMTFIICGVVCSTGYTFFLAQADTLGSKKLVSFLVFFYNVGKIDRRLILQDHQLASQIRYPQSPALRSQLWHRLSDAAHSINHHHSRPGDISLYINIFH